MVLLVFAGCASDAKIDRVNVAPVVEIEAPVSGELFRQGVGVVALRGSALDTYDDPADLFVTWTVDDVLTEVEPEVDGLVGLDLETAGLALGEHLATLTATDSDGETSEVETTFVVGGPYGAPTVEITAPQDGSAWITGESATFTGLASDTTTPAGELAFAWSSDRDGALDGAITADGQSALITDALRVGTHLITLSVTDGDGEVGSDAITVTVNVEKVPPDPDPEPPEPGELIFSEIMVNPNAAEDEDGEWVELYNTSGNTLDIAGYSFHDDGADYWVFDASVIVEPHGYIVLCANPNPSINGQVPCDGWFYRNPMGEQPTEGLGHGSGVAIANNDDEMVLTSPDGVDIDIFDYNDTTSDPIETGSAFGVDPTMLDGEDNDDVSNWCVQTTVRAEDLDPGTPGTENDPCWEEM